MKVREITDCLRYPLYVIFHPAAGFYALRRENKGRVWMIVLLLFLFWLSIAVMNQYSGVVVNDSHPMSMNSLTDLAGIVGIFVLFSAANWSVACLMDGEGRFVDIAMVTAYSLIPMILVFIPATILSNFFVADEAAFYYMIVSISIIWFAVLLIVGIMTVHDYTVLKTVATIVLTVLSMAIILFLLIMFTMILQNFYTFIFSIYVELLY